MHTMLANMLGKDKSEIKEDFDQMPIHTHMIYLAFQRQSKEKYNNILKKDPIQYKEAIEYIEFAEFDEEDDILSTLESNILGDLKPWFYSDSAEIGYPAKFATKILDDEKWEIQQIIRSKSLEENKLLTDENIISEMRGDTGVSNVILKQACSIEHKAKYNEIKKFAQDSLKYNPIWLNHIKIFFRETDELKDYDLEINVFNPYNIILTLMHIIAKNDFRGYAPNYQLLVSKNSHKKIYFGVFHWNGKKPNLEKIIKKYYDDDPGNILMTLLFGGHEWNNDDILEDLGLSYQSYLYDEIDDASNLFLYKNFKFSKIKDVENGLVNFIESNFEFMSMLEYIYKTHHHEAKIDFE